MKYAAYVSACFLLVIGVLVTVVGGFSDSNRPDVYTVEGTVVFRGEAVANAQVTFMTEGAARVASGRTDEEGRFHLTTFEPGDGAITGLHKVTVRLVEDTVDMTPSGDPLNMRGENGAGDPAAMYTSTLQIEAESDGVHRVQQGADLLPTKYANSVTTDLEFEVTNDETTNVFAIELFD